MGNNGSRPHENAPATPIAAAENNREPEEEIIALSICVHEKYEELTYNELLILEKPARFISPGDLFYIAVCYPNYCKSVHDMIRHAIRTESMREEKEQKDYLKQFKFSENMDYSRVKISERCQLLSQFRNFLRDSKPLPIKINSNTPPQQENEINFQHILTILRNYWIINNKDTIKLLINACHSLTDLPTSNFNDKNLIRQILSQIMGNEFCEAFVPHKSLNWEEIESEFNELMTKISKPISRCCMTFPNSKPLNKISVNGKIIRHGICSNGTFLFILTKEKKLFVYLLYRGIINKCIKQINLNPSWNLNEKTFMFCSQKWLFIKDNNITFQSPISNILDSKNIRFMISKRPELAHLIKACSNGASYSIVNTEKSFQIFNSENDKPVFNVQNSLISNLLLDLDPSAIIVSNGFFYGLISNNGKVMILPVNLNEPELFEPEDTFPMENDQNVEAITIDVLTSSYFCASFDGTKSYVYTYAYTGAPDVSLFGLKIQYGKTNNSVGNHLLKLLTSCALSSTIPENLITSSDKIETDLICIVKWIEKWTVKNPNDSNMINGLLLLLDLNFSKHNNYTNIIESFLPTLIKLINLSNYKKLASAVLVHNIDYFFNKMDQQLIDLLKIILNHSGDNDGEIFNEWILSHLWQSSIFSKIEINEELLVSLFGNDWWNQSRKEECTWIVDMLLIAQQNMIEKAVKILEKDPMDLEKSKLIESLCNYTQILLNRFISLLQQIVESEENKRIDYNSILFTLLSNFIAVAGQITHCSQFAILITSEDARNIIQLLSNEFIQDEKIGLFTGFFDTIFTLSISSLIRGGSVYSCEVDYAWLIHGNFNNGDRNLTPPELSQIRFFLSSIDDESMREFISKESDDINYLYNKIRSFKIVRNEHKFVDRIIMAAVCHQTDTFDLLSDAKNHEKIKPELNLITNFVKKIRNRFIHAFQNESRDSNSSNDIKQTDKYLSNMGILIILDPVLVDYKEKQETERLEYFHLLELFIQNNEPYQFHKVLKAVPTRINNVLSGFDRLNTLFQIVQNETLNRIIIDGISRVDSFERLGYLLSHAELDEHALNTLSIFCLTCIDMVLYTKQLPVLEILFTVLATCKNFKEKAIEVMNQLSKMICYDQFVLDSFFMTVAGLAESTGTLPQSFKSIPDIGKAIILQLIFANKKTETKTALTIQDLLNFIRQSSTERLILSDVWNNMIFTILNKCQFEDIETVCSLLQYLFQLVSLIIGDKCSVFSSLPEIIYGFRHILNSGNEISSIFQNIMATITIDSQISEIFLLFAIIAADIADYSSFYAVRNNQGQWLKYTIDDNDYCLAIPISPFSERRHFDIYEINNSIQEEELDLKMSLPFETVLSFWDVCMKDQGSMLCRIYLQALSRYISSMNQKLPEKKLSLLASSIKPYIDFHILSSHQTYLYMNSNITFNSLKKLLPETDLGFGRLEQSKKTHLFAYDIMKLGSFSIHVIFINEGLLIIHNRYPIVIEIPTGIINSKSQKLVIEDNILDITIFDEQKKMKINNKEFQVDEFASIEFIADSIDHIIFQLDRKLELVKHQVSFDDNKNIEHSDDIFEEEEFIENFVNDLNSIKPIKLNNVNNIKESEREGKNIFYNPMIEKIAFDERKPFVGSITSYIHICRENEVNICSQLKSVILAQAAIKDPDSLDWPTSFSLIKSAVIAVGGFNKGQLFNNKFPYSLEDGFFQSCSPNFLQSQNVQSFFIAIKTLLKSETFMNNFGKQLLVMAHDRMYHSLMNKKDLTILSREQLHSYKKKENDYFLIDFDNGSKGKLEIDDSGNWIVDTPMVLLLLLWLFIDHCSTPEHRICAKLTIVDCLMIKSPMINKYLPEFLSYIQKRMIFTPDDFNPMYIHHLSSLAANNLNNKQIIGFYEFEKNNFQLKTIVSNSINLDSFDKFELDSFKLNSSNMIWLIQLMKKFDSINDFPVWYFIPIWKTVSSISYIKYENKDSITTENKQFKLFNNNDKRLLFTIVIRKSIKNIKFMIFDNDKLRNGKFLRAEKMRNVFITHCYLDPNERKFITWEPIKDEGEEDDDENEESVEIQAYQIVNQEHFDNFESDLNSFALKWDENDTEQLMSEISEYQLLSDNSFWVMIETMKMTDLIKKFGLKTVQCKAACLFMINNVNNFLNSENEEMKRFAQNNCQYLSYRIRFNLFTILNTPEKIGYSMLMSLLMRSMLGDLTLDVDSALKFISGESNDVFDSMIYQFSRHAKEKGGRFKCLVWSVRYKGKESVDAGGVTNQTITMSVESFLCLRTGLCIMSPNNQTNNDENDLIDAKVIPYPSKDDEYTLNALFSFGVILGSIIRGGITQDIPFPLFVWNFLAGKEITKKDVYENDSRLKDEIDGLKNGTVVNHTWVYRDWNNSILKIKGFSDIKFVDQIEAEIYEKQVINLRIKSLEKYLVEIRKGFFYNQELDGFDFLSGGLISFLCQGKKSLDFDGIIKRIIFYDGDEQLKENFRRILKEYDESMMKSFLLFVTAHSKPPNFSIVSDYHINVKFMIDDDLKNFPHAATCTNTIEMPCYPTIDIMRDRLNYAVNNCIEMEVV